MLYYYRVVGICNFLLMRKNMSTVTATKPKKLSATQKLELKA